MNNYLNRVKKLTKFTITAITTAAIILIAGKAAAQAPRVNITVNILPPYSPYYSDYSGVNAGKVLLIIQNLTNNQVKVKLAGQLTGDNGIKIATYTNYVPLQPLILNAHETKQLNGQALKDIFDINNLSVSGVDKARLAQTSRLPEGNYNFCLQAYDYSSKALLSANAPLGCSFINITYPEPPVLVGPMPNEHLRAIPGKTLTLNWINPGTVPNTTQYKLEIAEMPDIAKDPNQVLNATSFPVLSTNVTGTSYIYNAGNVPLKPGKRYAWRVTSRDATNRVLFRNNGTSPASVFTYDPDNLPYQAGATPVFPVNQTGKSYAIGGRLTYQYHLADKTGIRLVDTRRQDEIIPLRYTNVQLCYGMAIVKMRITNTAKQEITAADTVKHRDDITDLGQQPQIKGKDSHGIDPNKTTYMVTDSIPQSAAFGDVTPTYDGTILANAKTDTNGNYHFNFKTDKRCYIVNTLPNNRAVVYCYYINVVNPHYTDPRTFVYARTPIDKEISSVTAGTQNVFVKNYKLKVEINRYNEGGTDLGQPQNASVEGLANEDAQVYILRKYKSLAIPNDEGDNTGRPEFVPQAEGAKQYFKDKDKYYVVSKKAIHLEKGKFYEGITTYYGENTFYNMVDNLNTENYWVYAEYKNSKVFFQPKEFAKTFYDDDEYQPDASPSGTGLFVVELKPSYVSLIVRGVLKYKFKDGTLKPLANTTVNLESVSFQNDGNNKPVYDNINYYKQNESYIPTTTDANGYFELDAGQILYKNYKGYSGTYGFKQFIKVMSPYYGSPDDGYAFEAGKTYNVGEVVAHVKDFSYQVKITGKNSGTGIVEALKGQRVYICRRADFNGQDLGIPDDEGEQNSVPIKTITDNYPTNFKVVGYGETDADGLANFKRLVVTDPQNGNDNYYVYSESGILSALNYSMEYGTSLNVQTTVQQTNFHLNEIPYLNKDIDNINLFVHETFNSTPQKPYIDGGVYPKSNTSTNAMPGVTVKLYDMHVSDKYSSDDFKNDIGLTDAAALAEAWVNKKRGNFQEQRTTSGIGLFTFNNPVTDTYKGWKLLIYSKDGFVSGYTIINSGKPMGSGVKENVKGFILPPKLLMATVVDHYSGAPVKSKIIVGDNFSWKETQTVGSPAQIEFAKLTSTYGTVKFTVIPDDAVNYKSQTFILQIAAPETDFFGQTPTDQDYTQLDPFQVDRAVNTVQVCVSNEAGSSLGAVVSITGLPPNETPPQQVITAKNCTEFTFQSNALQYGIKVQAGGYITQENQYKAYNAPGSKTYAKFVMQTGVSIWGKVTLDGVAVNKAKVYLKELASTNPEATVTTNSDGIYYIYGLPKNNNVVTVVAIAPDKNAVGKPKAVALLPIYVNGKPTNDIQVDMPLTSNKDIDITTLYGFPLDVESLTKKANGNYNLNGRVKINPNKNLQPGENAYLTIKDAEVKTITPAGKKLSVLDAVAGKVTVAENSLPIMAYGRFPAILAKKSGIEIVPADATRLKGSIYSGLTTTTASFTRNINWDGAVNLVPNPNAGKDSQQGNNNGGTGITPAGGNVDNLIGALTPAGGNINPVAIGNNSNPGSNVINLIGTDLGLGNQDYNGNIVPDGNNIGFYTPVGTNTHDDDYAEYTGDYFNVFPSALADVTNDKLGLHLPNDALFKYTLNNTYNVDASKASYLDVKGLHLFSTIHTHLLNANTADINLNAGDMTYDEKPMVQFNGAADLSIPLDSWKLSGKWHIREGALKIIGNIFAGTITVPVTDMEVSDSDIGFGDVNVNGVGLAGVYTMSINPAETFTSFGYDKAAKYGTLNNAKYGAWSLSLLPIDEKNALAQVGPLPDLNESDRISIMNITLYSKGLESRILLMQNQAAVTLNGFSTFQPYEIENGSNYITINGSLNLNIPSLTGLSNQVYSLNYAAEGGNLAHKTTTLPPLNLVTNGIRVAFNTDKQVFTNGVLNLQGALQDKVSKSPYTFVVKLTKTNADSQDITVVTDKSNVMDLGKPQQLTNISGSMSGTSASWQNFNFQGDVVGTTGMREAAEENTKKTIMKFEVKGDLVANKSEVGVKNLEMDKVKNMSITYDFALGAIIGSFHVDESTSNADFSTDFEFQLGSGQWYLLGASVISNITGSPLPVNGATGAVVVGSCTLTPDMMQVLQAQFHDGVLPNDFEDRFHTLTGALLICSVEMDLPIIPDINLNLGPIASVKVEKGIYANAYVSIGFEDAIVITGGIKVGVYVKVHAAATVLVGCAGLSLSAEVNAQVNEKLVLPTFKKMLTLNPVKLVEQTTFELNAEAAILLSGDAYFGFGLCDDDCNSITFLNKKIPPGCFKKEIGKDMTLKFGLNVTKHNTTSVIPETSELYIMLFGTPHSVKVNIPNFGI